MRLNSLKAAPGSRRKPVRLGRGMGSGLGKTCGHGHKGQTSRSGYSRKNGFEGGQLPLQRRLPKFGFNTRKTGRVAEIRLDSLNNLGTEAVDLRLLKDLGLISSQAERAKIILAGELKVPIKLVDAKIRATVKAEQMIRQMGGTIEVKDGLAAE